MNTKLMATCSDIHHKNCQSWEPVKGCTCEIMTFSLNDVGHNAIPLYCLSTEMNGNALLFNLNSF